MRQYNTKELTEMTKVIALGEYKEIRKIGKTFGLSGNTKKKDLKVKLTSMIGKAIELQQINEVKEERARVERKIDWQEDLYKKSPLIKVRFVVTIKFNYNGYKVDQVVGSKVDLPKEVADYCVKTLKVAVCI